MAKRPTSRHKIGTFLKGRSGRAAPQSECRRLGLGHYGGHYELHHNWRHRNWLFNDVLVIDHRRAASDRMQALFHRRLDGLDSCLGLRQ